MYHIRFHLRAVLLAGVCLGAWLAVLLTSWLQPAARANNPPPQAPDLAALAAEIVRMKDHLPDQAHVMQDVGYLFGNLWFAGQSQHGDLAHFYWSETRSHLRWAVRVIPIR